ncbi:MAG: site-2 protease family protein [Nitrososphaerales archaeon]|jgi:Zn-dependent protease
MTSQFAPREILSIILAWAVLSVAISYSYMIGLAGGNVGDLDYVVAAAIATFCAFIIHEMGHKFVAIRRGYVAHFQIWIWGIALALITAVASGGRFLFGAPGAVYIAPAAAIGAYGYGYYASNRRMTDPIRENMLISAAGPGVNLAFAIFFLILYETSTTFNFIVMVAYFGLELNVVLGTFNMLPIPPLDGSKIFKKSIPIALAIALPLWGLFLYFFLL